MFLVALTAAVVLALLMGCSNALLPPAEQAEVYPEPTEKTIIYPAEVYYETGTLGEGAQYELWLPRWWNLTGRHLLIFVHGYVSPNQKPTLPDDIDQETLDMLLSQGFGVAQSSFSETGWAVKDGAYRTLQLLKYIKAEHGYTRNVYLVGASEGGIIALRLTEYHFWHFRGTLSLCSLVGGTRMEMEYLTNTRVLFDYFFGERLEELADAEPLGGPATDLNDALGEGVLEAKPPKGIAGYSPQEFAQYMTPVFLELIGDSAAVNAMAAVHADGLPLYPWTPDMVPEVNVGLEFAAMLGITLWYNIYGVADLLERTDGRCMVDNTDTVYTIGGQELSTLYPDKQDVERLEGDWLAQLYLWRWYEPKGIFRIPVVTLHTTRDPAVPLFHEYALLEKARRRGSAHMLAQFQLEGFGHCELLEPGPGGLIPQEDPAFGDVLPVVLQYLVDWTKGSGARPDPSGYMFLTPLAP
jgi:pimeloyl-ACP methyl ester carboxylesterase